MCLIAVKETGVDIPKEEYLRNGALKNSDGTGIAWKKAKDNKIKIKKDFDSFGEFYEFINKNITKEDILIIHFRWATAGLKDKGNRHPFPIIKDKDKIREVEMDCKMVAAHNGVISQFSEYRDTSKKYLTGVFSDTQKFILEILADGAVKNNLNSEAIQMLINDFLRGDRLVTLKNNGDLLYFGDWKTEEGIMYSNDSYSKTIIRNREPINKWKNTKEEIFDWKKYYLNGYKIPKEQKQIETNIENSTIACEGCGKYKKTKQYLREGTIYYLCKKCRKKANKGKLSIFISNLFETKTEKKSFCDSCGLEVEDKKLNSIMGEYKVCKECYDIINSNIQEQENFV